MKRNFLFLILLLILTSCSTSEIRNILPGKPLGLASGIIIEDGVSVDKDTVKAGENVLFKVETDDGKIRFFYRRIYLDEAGYTQSKLDHAFKIDPPHDEDFTVTLPDPKFNSVEGTLKIPEDFKTGEYRIAVAGIAYNSKTKKFETYKFFLITINVLSKDFCDTTGLICKADGLFDCVENILKPVACAKGCSVLEDDTSIVMNVLLMRSNVEKTNFYKYAQKDYLKIQKIAELVSVLTVHALNAGLVMPSV